jgi:hypothetical protein
MWAVHWEPCPDVEEVDSGSGGSWLIASLTGCHSYLSCFRLEWLGTESNRRHADFQSAALPTELPSRHCNCGRAINSNGRA